MKDSPEISVISVVRNDKQGLARTIKSVAMQDYESFEYIVIDGNSSDGTDEVIKQNEFIIDQIIMEPDKGIYHAMNKAIKLAKGRWLIFMNAGDCFVNPTSLSNAAEQISDNVDVIFADWIYRESGARVKANINKLNVRHQSIIYKKELHETYGSYVVANNVTISDYIFFSSIANKNWKYSIEPISICEQAGVSAKSSHFYQRIYTEGLFSKRTRLNVVSILVLYPIYSYIKHNILRVR
jgi:glycosyltransferase involved in cell wall biosynthesis